MKVDFKVATIEDVDAIIELCNECFFENTDISYAKNIFEKTKDSLNDIYLIGVIDGKVIAHAKITIIETMYQPMGIYSILNHVCVKPEYRRHNIATKMLEEIEKICVEKECVKMELWSNNVRIPAHACYKKYGFHLDDAGFFSKEI
jgi:ribosomal protein S18 acetylase RimI-like enzyme